MVRISKLKQKEINQGERAREILGERNTGIKARRSAGWNVGPFCNGQQRMKLPRLRWNGKNY